MQKGKEKEELQEKKDHTTDQGTRGLSLVRRDQRGALGL
jgi:hypothetical protein